MNEPRWRLFERFGIELEYMIVDVETMKAMPIADRILTDADGNIQSDLEAGPLTWSNELVLHVLELKTGQPVVSLDGLDELLHAEIGNMARRLSSFGAMLMPGGMHPTLDPALEMRLWPHDNGEIYEAFDRIFDCRGHGWANLQSTHINLPFGDDDEFRRLHAAIRVVLPILPALAAASPIMDGRVTPWLDARLEVYRHNAARIPSVGGSVVPEPASSEGEYRDRILRPIYTDLAPFDPSGLLQEEWVNARGAIARFERNTIEIRVLDNQECPAADLAIAAAAIAGIRQLTEEATAPARAMNALPTDRLARILGATVRDAERATIDDREYLALFGRSGSPATARDLWDTIVERGLDSGMDTDRAERALEHILAHGCLARRILDIVGAAQRSDIDHAARTLSTCLARNELLGT